MLSSSPASVRSAPPAFAGGSSISLSSPQMLFMSITWPSYSSPAWVNSVPVATIAVTSTAITIIPCLGLLLLFVAQWPPAVVASIAVIIARISFRYCQFAGSTTSIRLLGIVASSVARRYVMTATAGIVSTVLFIRSQPPDRRLVTNKAMITPADASVAAAVCSYTTAIDAAIPDAPMIPSSTPSPSPLHMCTMHTVAITTRRGIRRSPEMYRRASQMYLCIVILLISESSSWSASSLPEIGCVRTDEQLPFDSQQSLPSQSQHRSSKPTGAPAV